MPSLVLFGRRTCFAGDDLRFLSIAHATYRIFQLCVAISLSAYVYNTAREDDSIVNLVVEICQRYGRMPTLTSNALLVFHFYMASSFLLCAFSLSVLWPMYHVSGLGTPTDVEPRRPLFSICYCDLLWVNFLRVSACTLGGMLLYTISTYCNCLARSEDFREEEDFGMYACPAGNPVLLLSTILFASHCVDVGFVVATFLWFTYRWVMPPTSLVSSEQKCKMCLRCCVGCASVFTCCLFGGRDALFGDFADFARIFSNFLHDNNILDLTPSDVLVGLHMVRRQERHLALVTQKRLQKESSSDHEANRTIDPRSHKVLMTGRFSSGGVKNDDKSTNDELSTSYQTEHSESSIPNIADGCIDQASKDDHRPENQEKVVDIRVDADIEAQSKLQSNASNINDSNLEILSRYQPRDVYLIAEGTHFMPICQSIYTSVSYMLEYPISGWCKFPYLILRRCACLFPTNPRDKVVGDYPWQPHTVALTSISGHSESDLVYASYYDSAKRIPYCIILDHDWKTVVVAIRGTLTLEGIFKDISIQPKELTVVGDVCGFDGRGKFCHTGMLTTSEWVLEDLQRHGHLDKLLSGRYKDYKLRIIGHSLGAGVASILSVLLRPKYPNLRCLAFSPPGCVMSMELADACTEWTTSFIVGDDIVPRMSIEGFEKLRDGVLDMICRIKVPKYQVTRAQQELHDDKSMSNQAKIMSPLHSILYDEDEVKDSKFRQQVLEFRKFQAEMKQKNASQYIELCLPGEIIELFKHKHRRRVGGTRKGPFVEMGSSLAGISSSTSSNVRENATKQEREGHFHGSGGGDDDGDDNEDDEYDDEEDTRQFTARRAHRDEFRRVIISPHLLSDHDPIGVKKRLQDVAVRQFGLIYPFSEKDLIL